MFQLLRIPDLEMRIVIPGSEIPEWFSHQSMGPEVNIKLHYSHLCNEVMGIAVCAVVCSDATSHKGIKWNFIVNGNEIPIPKPGVDIATIASDHILLSYSSTIGLEEEFSKSLVEYDANGFCQIGIRFEIDYPGKETFRSSEEVKKCGLRLLYKKDIEYLIPTDSDSDSDSDSNDVPIPRRRLPEFDYSDSEESSEYKDCDEELSDVQ
jgi:hypothetical protein